MKGSCQEENPSQIEERDWVRHRAHLCVVRALPRERCAVSSLQKEAGNARGSCSQPCHPKGDAESLADLKQEIDNV